MYASAWLALSTKTSPVATSRTVFRSTQRSASGRRCRSRARDQGASSRTSSAITAKSAGPRLVPGANAVLEATAPVFEAGEPVEALVARAQEHHSARLGQARGEIDGVVEVARADDVRHAFQLPLEGLRAVADEDHPPRVAADPADPIGELEAAPLSSRD